MIAEYFIQTAHKGRRKLVPQKRVKKSSLRSHRTAAVAGSEALINSFILKVSKGFG